MKLAKRSIPPELEGHIVSLLPEDEEDMWHAYNLIIPGDLIHAHTSRKVNREENPTKANTTERKHLELAIKVRDVNFDPVTSILRLTGSIATPNEWAPMGSMHSIEIEPNRSFSLIRPDPSNWDSVAQKTLQQALADDKNGALAAVVMQEGLANICLITSTRTLLKTRVESVVPKKRDASSHQDAGMQKFYDKTLQSLIRALDFTKPRPVLLASPGFVAEGFKKYIADQGRLKADKTLISMAKLISVVHAPSGQIHSLNEVLKDPTVAKQTKDVKYQQEAELMERFQEKLKLDDGRAWYGAKAVERAVQEGAVGTGGGVLLINNSLFRSTDLAKRKRFVALVDKVEADGGVARVLSSDHGSGQQLQLLGDIAAILTYPMQDLDDDDEEEEPEAEAVQRHHEDDIDMMDSVI